MRQGHIHDLKTATKTWIKYPMSAPMQTLEGRCILGEYTLGQEAGDAEASGCNRNKNSGNTVGDVCSCFYFANKHLNPHSLVPVVVSQLAVPQRLLMSTTLAENFSFLQAHQPHNLRR